MSAVTNAPGTNAPGTNPAGTNAAGTNAAGTNAADAHTGRPNTGAAKVDGGNVDSTTADSAHPDDAHSDTSHATANPQRARTIAEVLADARARLVRVPPERAHAEHSAGALLVDIRPAAQRAVEGSVPGAVVIERNVLEWRLDPASDARLPVASHDLRVLVLCSEGYTSSLAAASLLDLGITGATDVEGGFAAWRAAGLPAKP